MGTELPRYLIQHSIAIVTMDILLNKKLKDIKNLQNRQSTINLFLEKTNHVIDRKKILNAAIISEPFTDYYRFEYEFINLRHRNICQKQLLLSVFTTIQKTGMEIPVENV